MVFVDEGPLCRIFTGQAPAVSRCDFTNATGEVLTFNRGGVWVQTYCSLLHSGDVPLLLPSFLLYLFIGVLNTRGWSCEYRLLFSVVQRRCPPFTFQFSFISLCWCFQHSRLEFCFSTRCWSRWLTKNWLRMTLKKGQVFSCRTNWTSRCACASEICLS